MEVFSVRGDIKDIEKHLSASAKRHLPFATALALTRTAQFAQQKIKEEIARSFDRPKPYTLGATYVQPATKQRLWAMVKIKDEAFKSLPPIKWLAAEIYGGQRKHKAFETLLIRAGAMPANSYAIPTKAAGADQYGNIPASELNRMLSDLQARRDPYQNSTPASRGRRARSRTKRPAFYFSTYPVTARTAHLAPGVYKRTHFGVGAAIKPIVVFASKARYRRRLKFFETADQVSRMRWPIEFALAMKQALRTAK
jgi:hypothetical protein